MYEMYARTMPAPTQRPVMTAQERLGLLQARHAMSTAPQPQPQPSQYEGRRVSHGHMDHQQVNISSTSSSSSRHRAKSRGQSQRNSMDSNSNVGSTHSSNASNPPVRDEPFFMGDSNSLSHSHNGAVGSKNRKDRIITVAPDPVVFGTGVSTGRAVGYAEFHDSIGLSPIVPTGKVYSNY